MERATECTNLIFRMSQVPVSAEEQSTESREAHGDATTQARTGNVRTVACPGVKRTADEWHWTTNTASANASVLSDGKCAIAAAAASPPGLSTTATEEGPAELLRAEQHRGSTATAQAEEQGLPFSSVNGAASAERDSSPHPSNPVSIAQGSTVSPRDFLSSPPAGGAAGLPLWSGDTPTAAATASDGRDRGPFFCRPLQSPSLCRIISVQQLGGIPLLSAGGCELMSPSIEGSQQRSNAASPHGENMSKKFFFSAPFTTPPDPSGAAASGFFGGLVAASAAQSRSAAESPSGAELATRSSNVCAADAAKSYAEECQIDWLAPGVPAKAAATQGSLLHLQSRALHGNSALQAATAAAIAGAPGPSGAGGRAIGGEVESGAAAGLHRPGPSSPTGGISTASRGGRGHRGVRPAAKSAILRCSKRCNTGAAAVVTAAAARNSLSKAAAQKRNVTAGVRLAGAASAAAVADLQQSLLSAKVGSAATASQDLRWTGITGTFAVGPAQSNTAAEAAAANEAEMKAAAGLFPGATARGVSFALNTLVGGQCAADAAADVEGKGGTAGVPSEARELEAVRAAGELNTGAGAAAFASGLYEGQDQQKATSSLEEAIVPNEKKKNTGKIIRRAGAGACRAVHTLKKVTTNLYARDGNRTYSVSHRLQPRASPLSVKPRSRVIERASSASPRPLHTTRRLPPQGRRGFRLASTGLRTQGPSSSNNSISRRRRQLKGKKAFAETRSLHEATCKMSVLSCSSFRRRPSAAAIGSEARDNNGSNTADAAAEVCAAPLASALCGIEEDVAAEEEGASRRLRLDSAGPAAEHAKVGTSPLTSASPSGLLLQFDGSSSKRHSSRTGGAGIPAGYPVLRFSHREDLPPHSQQVFSRRSGAATTNVHRVGAKGGMATGSPSCGGAAGSLSERIRMIVEKAMMSKHKIVWIERSEAKGFLPLPGMQEEKVYLVWTEKGIDVLVDLQAYIPWTHCPILMPRKHRRLHIPLLILSSTSLSSLFSHVCRRTATSVFRLPLTRTPPAYRRSMLQRLRGEEFEQRQQQEGEQQQHTVRQRDQQEQQGEGECTAMRTDESAERRRRTGRTPASSRDSERVVANRMSNGSFCAAGTHTEEAAPDRLSQSFSPCSTSAGSTGPSSLPSPPATDATAACETGVGAADASRAESCVCAAGVVLQRVVGESVAQANKEREQQEHSPEAQQQQQQKQQEHQESCGVAGDRSPVSNGALDWKNVAGTAATVAATTKDAAHQQTTAAAGDGNDTTANAFLRADEKGEAPPVCKEKGSKQESRKGLDGETKVIHAITEIRAVPLTQKNNESECATAESLSSRLSALSDSVKAENRLTPQERLGEAHKGSLVTTATAVPFSQKNKSATEDSRRNAVGASAAAESSKKGSLDMRDFYCCSQGKVVGEDYVYFRQTLPDDEGADVYDISVSVKKRAKKTLLRKPRLAALWSMLAKRDQQVVGEAISTGGAGPTNGGKTDFRGQTNREGESAAATLGDARTQSLVSTQAAIGDSPRTGVTEVPPIVGASAAAAVREGDAGAVASQFAREELLRVLAQPEETVGTPAALETSTGFVDGTGDDEKKQAWRGSKWTYVEEYGDEGLDERLCLPIVFLSEMRVLLGLAASSTPHRCNMSLASHRVSGAVQRRVRMFLCDGENRGREIEVYAEGLPLAELPAEGLPAAGGRLSGCPLWNDAVEQHAQQSGSDGGAEEKAARAGSDRQKRGRVGERMKKTKRGQSNDESSVLDARKRHQKEQSHSKSRGDANTTEEKKACVISSELPNKGAVGLKSAREVDVTKMSAAGKISRQGSEQHTPQCPAEGKGNKCVGKETDISLGESGCSDGEGTPPDSLTGAEDGTLVEVEFPTEFVQYRESDRIRLYGRTFLTRSLQILADVSGICSGADLSAVNLAQYAPNLFWNVVRFSSRREDLDEVLKELCPAVSTLRRRRKRLDGGAENYTRQKKTAREGCEEARLQQVAFQSEECTYALPLLGAAHTKKSGGRVASVPGSGSDGDSNRDAMTLPAACGGNRSVRETTFNAAGAAAGPLPRQLQREERRQKELELRFQEMKIEFDERAKRILARRDALKNDIFNESKWSKKSRLPAVPENDDGALINAVIDPEGVILKWPLSAMTVRQKNVIYEACLKRDLTACICLTRVPGKGRAVFAADRILKDDFVVEYKGELCSEREAREREQKYNRSKVPMGSFMFYFKNGSRLMAIDATDEKQDFGPARLINHSRRNPNMTPRAILLNESHGEPRLIFVARRNIEKGEELLVDYGERDPDVIREHPWLNN